MSEICKANIQCWCWLCFCCCLDQMCITSPAVGDHLLAVIQSLGDRALEQRPGARRVRLQIVAERCAHQNPGKNENEKRYGLRVRNARIAY